MAIVVPPLSKIANPSEDKYYVVWTIDRDGWTANQLLGYAKMLPEEMCLDIIKQSKAGLSRIEQPSEKMIRFHKLCWEI